MNNLFRDIPPASPEEFFETLASGRVCYWSRSRQALWRKGESSGQVQQLKELRVDCDGDTLLLRVDQTGPACHTGRRDCFYQRVEGDRLVDERVLRFGDRITIPSQTTIKLIRADIAELEAAKGMVQLTRQAYAEMLESLASKS